MMDGYDNHTEELDELGAVTTETKGPPVKHVDGIGGLSDTGLSAD